MGFRHKTVGKGENRLRIRMRPEKRRKREPGGITYLCGFIPFGKYVFVLKCSEVRAIEVPAHRKADDGRFGLSAALTEQLADVGVNHYGEG